jgi:hypothetical protein
MRYSLAKGPNANDINVNVQASQGTVKLMSSAETSPVYQERVCYLNFNVARRWHHTGRSVRRQKQQVRVSNGIVQREPELGLFTVSC